MMCLFNFVGTTVKTNEEFRKVLEKKIKIFIVVMIIGIITAGIAILNEVFGIIVTDSWLSGVYAGLGTGLIAASIVQIIRFKKILKDENLIKEERLRTQDERNQMISIKAMRAAIITVLFLSYAVLLVAAFYSRVIFFCFWWVVMVFLLSYLIFTRYYNTKM